MSYEAVGTLHTIYDTAQVTDKFRKREFVLEMQDGAYTQHVKFQMTQDKCAVLDNFRQGDSVKVMFNLRGRMSTNRNGEQVCYSNLDAWRVERADASAMNTSASQTAATSFAPVSSSSDEDLPF